MMSKSLRLIVTALTVFLASCTGEAATVGGSTVLVGSTPGGAEIKAALGIDASLAIDFIRWEMRMQSAERTFSASVNYGEGQPNTRGFKGGGEWKKIEGRYSLSQRGAHQILTFDGSGGRFWLIGISENVYHFLDSSGRLLAGTGGWGYSLSRRERVGEKPVELTSISRAILNERSPRPIVFTGRTPCVEFKRADLEAAPDCLKLKWKLTLERDPVKGTPTRYKLESTVSRLKPVVGTWTFDDGTRASPKALLIELDGADAAKWLAFFVADDKVIYLLADGAAPGIGNDDFGYALTRME